MALSADRNLDRYVDQRLRSMKLKDDAVVYKGGFVGTIAANGYARALAAGDLFVGIAFEGVDATNAGDGAKSVRVETEGDFVHTLAGAALTDIGAAVYASDDGTITKTALSNSFIGTIIDLVAANTVIVRLDAFKTAAQA